jgi:hypothetical protein
LFFGIVNQYLAGHISVVIEAAFQHKVWEPRMPKILELASPLIVFKFGVPYGSRTRVAAVKEKGLIVIQWNFAAWIALYRI